jgi:hypothetical protein
MAYIETRYRFQYSVIRPDGKLRYGVKFVIAESEADARAKLGALIPGHLQILSVS